jgi:cytochrome c peroxidase
MEQANGPIHNPVEMGLDAKEVEQRINAAILNENENTYQYQR